MVPTIRATFLLLLASALPAMADLDLTPAQATVMKEDMHFKSLVFHDGDTEISYVPPAKWTYSGDKSNLMLTPPDHPGTEIAIRVAPRPRVTLDDAGAKALQANPALLGLPKGATDINVKLLAVNPVKVGGHNTLEAEVAFGFFGQACVRDVLLVDRKGMEVSFVLDCPAADYAVVKKTFRQSLFSLDHF